MVFLDFILLKATGYGTESIAGYIIRCICFLTIFLKSFYISSTIKAEPLPLSAYFVNKGKILPWITILPYRYLPKSLADKFFNLKISRSIS